MKKRIGIVGYGENQGGLETYIIKFADRMADVFDIVFININESKHIAYEDHINEKQYEIFHALSHGLNFQSFFGRTAKAKQALSVLRLDYVYVNALSVNSAYWIKAAKSLGIKAVYHSHNNKLEYTSFAKRVATLVLLLSNRYSLKYATRLAVSEDAGKFMFGRQKFDVIYNSVNPETWRYNSQIASAKRQELSIPAESRVVLVVGRMQYQKNYPKILGVIFEEMASNEDVHAIVVGDGDERSEIEKAVHKSGYENRIHILGMRSDVPDLMSASNVLLLPSRFEGLPFVVIESQASGLEVLTVDRIVPNVVNETGHVTFLDKDDSNEVWAIKLNELLYKSKDNNRLMMNDAISQSIYSDGHYNQVISEYFKD